MTEKSLFRTGRKLHGSRTYLLKELRTYSVRRTFREKKLRRASDGLDASADSHKKITNALRKEMLSAAFGFFSI